MEYIAYGTRTAPQFQAGARSLDLNIVKPLLHDSLDEASRTLSEKFKQSDLIIFLLQPHPDATQALDSLHTMLTLPSISAQINRSDLTGERPIYYAARAFPEAVEVLLQAGASPKRGTLMLFQYAPGQWKAVSALIRAGYPMDERDYDAYWRSPLHSVAANLQPSYRHALELVRHGGHLLDWYACDEEEHMPFGVANYFANEEPDNEQLQLIRKLYRTQSIPHHAQYISSFDGERLKDAEEAATHPRISLIDTSVAGDVASIGSLISAGAMVNERDDEGRTLLHLIAMGDRVPHGYRVALELVRHGGHEGVDWDAETSDDQTALEIAEETLEREDLDDSAWRELEQICELLETRCLPPGESYVFPCMNPDFCRKCESLRCTCIENDVPGMPGSFVN